MFFNFRLLPTKSNSFSFLDRSSLTGLFLSKYALLLLFSFFAVNLSGQACNCTDYLYVTDPSEDIIHKFTINSDGSIGTEIGSPWLPTGQMIDPHGVVSDINGNLYSAQISGSGQGGVSTQLFQLSCDGTVLDSDYIPGWNRTLNLVSKENTIYGIGRDPSGGPYHVYSYDLCTQTPIDSIMLDNSGLAGWGLSEGEDGMIYATQSFGSNTTTNHRVWKIEDDLSAMTLVVDIPNVPGYATHGVETDEFGNFYIMITDSSPGESIHQVLSLIRFKI